MRRTSRPTIAAVLAILALAACRGESVGEGAPARIIAIAPSVSEILFDLGLGGSLVGVGDYAAWPPEVASLPRLGGLYNAQLETVVELRPDLAVLIPSERELGERLRRLGIEVLVVESDSLAQVEAAILAIADRCGVPSAGAAAAARFSAGLEPRELPDPPRVVVTIGREVGRLGSVMVAGPATFVGELLERAGGINAFSDVGLPYPQVGAEELLGRAPRVVIELQSEPRSPAEVDLLLEDWNRLPGVPAVAEGCLSVISGSHTVLPGPRLPQLFGEIVAALDRCPGAGVDA